MKKSNLWFSYTLQPYQLDENSFYNPSDFEWIAALEAQYEPIKKEVLSFVDQHNLSPYFNKDLSSKANSWKTDGVLHWGMFSNKYYLQLKETWDIVKTIPGLVSVSVSLLKPQTAIKEHRGDTNAIIRVHLPLKVPQSAPACSFTVAGKTKSWQEGKALLFNDAQLHEAQNLTDETRIVLILDVIRPEFLNRQYQICASVINALKWQADTQKSPAIRNVPLWLLKMRWSFIRAVVRIMLVWNKRVVWP